MSASGFSPEFSELAAVIEDLTTLVDEVVARLADTGQLRPEMLDRLAPVPELFRARSADVIVRIRSGDYDTFLVDHELHDGDPAWEFKRAGYQLSRERYEAWLAEGQPPEEGDPPDLPWWKKWAGKAKKPLTWANVILRSVAAAIPGGGALNEIKDGVEATVDELDA